MPSKSFTRLDLEDMIKDVMGITTITPMIKKQINNFIIKDDMTFKEIARCVVFYIEVKHGEFQPMYGLGIIPNIREEAAKYFKKLELDQQRQLAEAQKIVEYQDNNIIFHIESLKHNKRQPKQFNIADIDVKGDE